MRPFQRTSSRSLFDISHLRLATLEITALPELLRCLAVTGCVVTIDAMGCQRAIAQQILDQEGSCVLALKQNQGSLHDEVQLSFGTVQADDFVDVRHDAATTVEKGHGRIETRHAWVIYDAAVIAWLQEQHAWPGLQAIGRVQAERRIGTQRTVDDRFYLLSRQLSARAFGEAVRNHWGIENRVHWVLNVTFHEDQRRIRAGYAAENFAVVRHGPEGTPLNLLRQQTVKRKSIKGRRLKAAWDTDFLLQVLTSI